MVVDYTIYTKAQLIDMLVARDAQPHDKEVLALKIQRMRDNITEIRARILAIDEIGKLNTDEKTALADLHNLEIAGIQAKIDQLQVILAGMVKTWQP